MNLTSKKMQDVTQRPLDEDSVKKSLEKEGYKSVDNVEREDNGYCKAEAEMDDVRLFVDHQGPIVEERDSDS